MLQKAEISALLEFNTVTEEGEQPKMGCNSKNSCKLVLSIITFSGNHGGTIWQSNLFKISTEQTLSENPFTSTSKRRSSLIKAWLKAITIHKSPQAIQTFHLQHSWLRSHAQMLARWEQCSLPHKEKTSEIAIKLLSSGTESQLFPMKIWDNTGI